MVFFGTLAVAGLVALGRPPSPGSLTDLPANVPPDALHAPDWDPVSATASMGAR
jgi:hypothetical protein